MADKEKLKIGGIAFMILLVGSLSGVGINEALQSDEPLYKCVDEETIRNCVNGVKADGKRCYYNESNPYSYDYCRSNWTKIDKDKVLEDLYKQEAKKGVNYGKQFRCNQTKSR